MKVCFQAGVLIALFNFFNKYKTIMCRKSCDHVNFVIDDKGKLATILHAVAVMHNANLHGFVRGCGFSLH